MTVEELYVNGYDVSEYAWGMRGSSPYLHDTNADYVYTALNRVYVSAFTFPNSAGSGTLNSVVLRFEGKNGSNPYDSDGQLYVWDGSAWQYKGYLGLAGKTRYSWVEVDVSDIINTWDKVNGLKVRLQSYNPRSVAVWVRRCTRKVDYSAVPAEGQPYVSRVQQVSGMQTFNPIHAIKPLIRRMP